MELEDLDQLIELLKPRPASGIRELETTHPNEVPMDNRWAPKLGDRYRQPENPVITNLREAGFDPTAQQRRGKAQTSTQTGHKNNEGKDHPSNFNTPTGEKTMETQNVEGTNGHTQQTTQTANPFTAMHGAPTAFPIKLERPQLTFKEHAIDVGVLAVKAAVIGGITLGVVALVNLAFGDKVTELGM